MAHPEIENRTPFAFEPVFIADEELRPVVVTVVKATFGFDSHGDVWLAEDQIPRQSCRRTRRPRSGIQLQVRARDRASGRRRPTSCLIGHAQPPGGGVTQVDVGIKVGPVQKVATVFGDRYWVMANQHGPNVADRPAGTGPTDLGERVRRAGRDPVDTRAHGRWSRAIQSVLGSARRCKKDGDHLKLPNIEDPTELIDEYGAVVTPCGFGFTSPDWQPRARLAGTYDDDWNKTPETDAPGRFRPAVLQRRGTGSRRARILARRRGRRRTQRRLRFPVWRSVCRVFRRRGAGSSCAAGENRSCRPTSTR